MTRNSCLVWKLACGINAQIMSTTLSLLLTLLTLLIGMVHIHTVLW